MNAGNLPQTGVWLILGKEGGAVAVGECPTNDDLKILADAKVTCLWSTYKLSEKEEKRIYSILPHVHLRCTEVRPENGVTDIIYSDSMEILNMYEGNAMVYIFDRKGEGNAGLMAFYVMIAYKGESSYDDVMAYIKTIFSGKRRGQKRPICTANQMRMLNDYKAVARTHLSEELKKMGMEKNVVRKTLAQTVDEYNEETANVTVCENKDMEDLIRKLAQKKKETGLSSQELVEKHVRNIHGKPVYSEV